MIDWRQAFDRQCPKLGIQSFMQNGGRRSLIPLLVSYLQNRKNSVKWHGLFSKLRSLNGGGPQGALWGILEYLSISNNNTNYISRNEKFKFIDDLSILEKINLLSIGLSSYNYQHHVASDIIKDGYFVEAANLKSQENLDKIAKWTEQSKMLLNKSKTKLMVFNFTRNFQLSTRLCLENEVIETINETKLLGVMMNDSLNWDTNTGFIVKRAKARMRLLHKLVSFSVPVEDLTLIYNLYIRSVLEQSCQVWHSSLSFHNLTDIERVQKNALKIILQEDYCNYEHALKISNLDSLVDRREMLCLKFAKSCVKNNTVRDMFPVNPVDYHVDTRDREVYNVTMANTERLRRSAVPYMQRMLNSNL